MKILITIITFLRISFQPIDIYSINIPTIDGQVQNLSTCKGKKMLLVVIPAKKDDSDSILLRAATSAYQKYNSKLTIIAIPSAENGIGGSQKQLKLWLRKYLDNNIVIAAPLKTARGIEQHPIFSWLTNKDYNLHFDRDTVTIGDKYFISESGELYAVYDSNTRLDDRILTKAINR